MYKPCRLYRLCTIIKAQSGVQILTMYRQYTDIKFAVNKDYVHSERKCCKIFDH